MLADGVVGQARDNTLDHGILAVVDANGVIGGFGEDAVSMIIRVVRSDEFAANSDCSLTEIPHSPPTFEIVVIPLLDVGGKHRRSNALALTDAKVPETKLAQL